MPGSILQGLAPDFPDPHLEQRVRDAVARSDTRLVVFDDDPTGVQAVHDIAVLTRWSVGELAAELRKPTKGFFVLTNTRSLAPRDAIALTRELCGNLVRASAETDLKIAIASRSDSTLRGHFPEETATVAACLGGVDAVLLCPAFIEGGRYTIDDTHYVEQGDQLVPVGETEFALDDAFGYQQSNLHEWIKEKSQGRIVAQDVTSLSLSDIRDGGPDHILARLMHVRSGQHVVVNAASYQDLFVVALAVMQAEQAGKRFVYRCGASFVRARLGMLSRTLLSKAEIFEDEAGRGGAPGLVIVGSHVGRTRRQLQQLLNLPNIAPIEVPVPDLLVAVSRRHVVAETASRSDAALGRGVTPVIFTSEKLQRDVDGEGSLAESRQVSAGLVDVVRAISGRPTYILAKGGITSSDIGTKALDTRRAMVLGQIRPGVPVWRLGPESRFPGLPYIIFPGNVGDDESLEQIVSSLSM